MTKEWLNSYLDFLYKGHPNQALAHKTENMNSILYRFERFEECRLNTLENSKIYLSNPNSFNDVFDTKGIYYTKDFLKSFQEKYSERLPSFDEFLTFLPVEHICLGFGFGSSQISHFS